MVSEKVLHFQGKNKDLNQLSQQIVQQLSSEGYKTQSSTAPLGIVIQGDKGWDFAGYHHCGQSVYHPHNGSAE